MKNVVEVFQEERREDVEPSEGSFAVVDSFAKPGRSRPHHIFVTIRVSKNAATTDDAIAFQEDSGNPNENWPANSVSKHGVDSLRAKATKLKASLLTAKEDNFEQESHVKEQETTKTEEGC